MAEQIDPASGLRTAIAMADAGVEMMRARLRREHPGTTDREIEQKIHDWLRERPGAPFGDGVGVPGTWPRTGR
jgi:Rv0078B-related antitoxin